MRRFGFAGWRAWLALLAVSPGLTFAAADDGAALLGKIATATRQLTYSGVFVYRNGVREETSRIAHAFESGRQRERIEVLDGSPREVVREGQEVKCFLPEEKLLIVERQSGRRSFPSVLPSSLGNLTEYYLVRRGDVGRVAGVDAQALLLEPRDGYRYAHEMWVEPGSGLLLKASLIGEKGETLESFAFTQVKIGGPLEPGALTPRFEEDKVRVRKSDADDVRDADMAWGFRQVPPGFRKLNAMKRRSGGKESLHVVFSDGIAAISVFLEPAAEKPATGVTQVGPINIYRRVIEAHQAIVMGEVPISAVRMLGEGIERRGR